MDLRWSFNHSADQLWQRIDPELWELTHNPWVVLQTVSRERLQSVTSDPNFQKLLADLHRKKRTLEESEGWFQKAHPNSGLSAVAYFSMEFMLSEALPIYSGGLGNVAGDQLKTASNLGVPVIGVGLLYQQGYFRQEIDAQGQQQALYPFNDPGQLPIQPVRESKWRMAAPLDRLSWRQALDPHLAGARWAERNCISWIQTIPRIFRRTAASPRNSTEAVPSCA